MFSEEKSAQVAAYLLQKRGGQMSYLKLIKLMYLADRESMAEFGYPISDDSWFSMKHGPVLSNVLDLIQGASRTGEWERWVTGAPSFEVALANHDVTRDDYDELSEADIDVLDRVWEEHGAKTRWQLVEYTHDSCEEWHDPFGSARPISPQDMLKALGWTPESAEAQTREIFRQRHIHSVMAEMR
ncbi:Panacea domain-containing protein [Salinicola lusitanus]|uniref:Panacea domain-containing protein n=1 Tax=Salinicola lusitanus TaxID=1949085 RepID=UPI000DA158BC|nr:Panacea domain-containing protein [Salinicola lusitanus]